MTVPTGCMPHIACRESYIAHMYMYIHMSFAHGHRRTHPSHIPLGRHLRARTRDPCMNCCAVAGAAIVHVRCCRGGADHPGDQAGAARGLRERGPQLVEYEMLPLAGVGLGRVVGGRVRAPAGGGWWRRRCVVAFAAECALAVRFKRAAFSQHY